MQTRSQETVNYQPLTKHKTEKTEMEVEKDQETLSEKDTNQSENTLMMNGKKRKKKKRTSGIKVLIFQNIQKIVLIF